ncbi:MAG: hypothetical protein LQ345_004885 [Seirophora villosa]|nr:MAG: hypothetical protein LQ345_004885 [Seirophora villosa]
MELITRPNLVQTRFLIISDTRGEDFLPAKKPVKPADVAIHRGDLIEESTLEDYRVSVRLLKAIDAPLKLLIAGNHDFTMGPTIYEREIASAWHYLGDNNPKKANGDCGEPRQVFDEAKDAGIMFLNKGNHGFV